MKAGIYCVAALMEAMGMGFAGEVAAENNSSPAPSLGQQVTVTERQKARPDTVTQVEENIWRGGALYGIAQVIEPTV